MPAPYALPQNVTGFGSLGEYVNSVTGNAYGILVLVAATVIIYAVLSIRFSTKTAIGGTGVVMGLLAIVWRFAGQINDLAMFTFVILAIVSILYLQFTKT